MENNIVFIGYSLDDPNIRGLLSEVIEDIKKNSEATKKSIGLTEALLTKLIKDFMKICIQCKL